MVAGSKSYFFLVVFVLVYRYYKRIGERVMIVVKFRLVSAHFLAKDSNYGRSLHEINNIVMSIFTEKSPIMV